MDGWVGRVESCYGITIHRFIRRLFGADRASPAVSKTLSYRRLRRATRTVAFEVAAGTSGGRPRNPIPFSSSSFSSLWMTYVPGYPIRATVKASGVACSNWSKGRWDTELSIIRKTAVPCSIADKLCDIFVSEPADVTVTKKDVRSTASPWTPKLANNQLLRCILGLESMSLWGSGAVADNMLLLHIPAQP
ncbi:hypothetical protein CISG_08315 [Coccidioides immitis RMSCC 3703]|uniref:Uncharacterized protein n=1 Tax=Coccidioides immitis RMSCC 3703 TaxID=454286 RepID=A0A0J8R523_COCIT|nr:hypothetical protein CISG_08315 [Coccidioides immitis RMSCC 3703]